MLKNAMRSMFKNIMRSLGYVPLSICVDLNNEIAGLNRELNNIGAVAAKLAKQRDAVKTELSQALRHVDMLNERVAGLRSAPKAPVLISAYAVDSKDEKTVSLEIAGYSKAGELVTVPVRKLVRSKANIKSLSDTAAEISAAFGASNTTILPETLA